MELTRRNFLAVAGAAAGGMGLAALPAQGTRALADEGEPAPRVYEGTAQGLRGELTAHIALADDGSIAGVSVVSTEDSPFISDAAIEQVCSAMIELQSLDVDTASGATFTSLGIMVAARNALESAGVDTSRYAADPVEDSVADDVPCDVLVIGGGLSGLAAAATARANSDLSVMLVDQLAYTGGCVRVSDTMFISFNGTRHNLVAEKETPTDDVIAFAQENDANGYLNEALFRSVLDAVPDAVQLLTDRGLYLPVSDAHAGTIIGTVEGASWTVHDPTTGLCTGTAGGPYVAQSLEDAGRNAGVEFRKSTRVEGIDVKDGSLTGVRGRDLVKHASYTIRPRVVVLATGCIGASDERMAAYAPSAGGTVHVGCAGTNGDGIVWAEELGGVVLDGKVHYQPVPNNRLGQYTVVNDLHNQGRYVMVNLEGKRFFNEATVSRAVANTTYRAQPENKVFGIVSGEEAATWQEALDYGIAHGVAWKADDLAALAEACGIDADAFVETIEAYQAAYAAGEGTDFDTAHDQMVEVAEAGPYYAFVMQTAYNLADIGIKVDEEMRPVSAQDDPLANNLVAAGSLIVSNYGIMTGGFSHMMALTSGWLAGSKVREELAGA